MSGIVEFQRESPYWEEGNTFACKHSKKEYVGSFETTNGDAYDLYVINDIDGIYSSGRGVCIRYSDEANGYISPGDYREFIRRAIEGDQVIDYEMGALILLMKSGYLSKPVIFN